MLDIKFVRENPDLIKEAVRKKHLDFNVDELVEIDIKRLEILSLVEKLRTEQNKVTDKVAGIKDAGKREELIKEMKQRIIAKFGERCRDVFEKSNLMNTLNTQKKLFDF